MELEPLNTETDTMGLFLIEKRRVVVQQHEGAGHPVREIGKITQMKRVPETGRKEHAHRGFAPGIRRHGGQTNLRALNTSAETAESMMARLRTYIAATDPEGIP